MECTVCKTDNREIALSCKRCGNVLSTSPETGDSVLGSLVGLDSVRNELNDIINVIRGMQKDGNVVRMNYNLILTGNSGTAKSLIGELFFKALKKLDILSKEKPHFLDAGEFQSYDNEAIGNLVGNAKGGVIIIDNAQDLIQDGRAVGALKRLLVEMDKTNNDPVVVLSGLPYGMREYVSNDENSYFTGRFRKIFVIDDYGSETLSAIIKKYLAAKYGFTISTEGEEKLHKRTQYLAKEIKNPESKLGASNGYLAVREADTVVHHYYLRGGENKIILPEDISDDILEKKSAEEIFARFDTFIGMEAIKKDIKDMYARMSMEEFRGKVSRLNLHTVVTGNPGTGKTTVVRVLGGILFVDEAYALKQSENDSFGQEAIDTLLKRVEDDRDKFCCVVAGYKNEMDSFMSTNPGLDSRFPKRFHLEDYTAKELLDIFTLTMKQEGFQISEEGLEKARYYFEDRVARKTKDFANGREARNLFDAARGKLASRLSERMGADDFDNGELTLFTAVDIPSNRQEGGITVESAAARLNALIGLHRVKEKVKQLTDTLEMDRLRGQVKPLGEHFIFSGNPGTGETTVARILADIFFAIGLIPTNNLIEADRSALVASFSGQTSPKVNKLVDRAMGGILFIDEAYNLYQGQNDSFGLEAINILLKRLEDDRGKFICIAAGYKKEMHDFIQSNSGLRSRFTTTIEFEDYNEKELTAIFYSLCSKEGYELTDDAKERTKTVFQAHVARKTKDFGNARDVRRIFEATRGRLSKRIAELRDQGVEIEKLQQLVNVIESEDLPAGEAGQTDSVEKALERLDQQIGLESVKTTVRELINVLEVQKLRGQGKPLELHLLFKGNPGTGKTTIARILAEVFYAIGLLPANNLVEADRSSMVAGYSGQTSGKVNDLIDRAMGGMLFIDEAYALKRHPDDSFGQDAIDTLIKRMEDDRGKFVVIAAGYEKEMDRFLDTNSGLRSRFSHHFHFEDYSGTQLADIFMLFAEKEGFSVDNELYSLIEDYFSQLYENRDDNFGNARTVRQFFNTVVEKQSNRLVSLKQSGTVDEATLKREANRICRDDIPG
jgi:SpoVK/Ycf46/Vps4 family AAA+-type ATPase